MALGKVSLTWLASPLAWPGWAVQSGVSPGRSRRVSPPAWSKCRWLMTTSSMACGSPPGFGQRRFDGPAVQPEDVGHLRIELVAGARLDDDLPGPAQGRIVLGADQPQAVVVQLDAVAFVRAGHRLPDHPRDQAEHPAAVQQQAPGSQQRAAVAHRVGQVLVLQHAQRLGPAVGDQRSTPPAPCEHFTPPSRPGPRPARPGPSACPPGPWVPRTHRAGRGGPPRGPAAGYTVGLDRGTAAGLRRPAPGRTRHRPPHAIRAHSSVG
ncbi:MAG: hypothetical protein KatS3mg103_0464 [Phycisphaerales bacterium]|nr:MAG: hypothetical protein KatS3mg103_0464 [Phycisphaerales bacterium]